MNKLWLLGLVLLLIPLASANTLCTTYKTCSLFANDDTGGDGVNYTIYYSNSTPYGEYEMVSIGSTQYVYNISFNASVKLLGCAKSYNSTGTIKEDCEDIFVGIGTQDLQETNLSFGLLNNNLIILVFIVLLIIAILYLILHKK